MHTVGNHSAYAELVAAMWIARSSVLVRLKTGMVGAEAVWEFKRRWAGSKDEELWWSGEQQRVLKVRPQTTSTDRKRNREIIRCWKCLCALFNVDSEKLEECRAKGLDRNWELGIWLNDYQVGLWNPVHQRWTVDWETLQRCGVMKDVYEAKLNANDQEWKKTVSS